jgi:tRNA threonylcarbamoyladenosine biosynthesis protein TsaB
VNVLALETATETLAATVRTPNGAMAAEIRRVGLHHAEFLVPIVMRVLEAAGIRPSDLDLIVYSAGPGSFTGLRIGIAAAKGMAMGSGCDIVGVPTLDVMAHGATACGAAVIPVVDAKKRRVYCAVYRDGSRQTDYLDIEPDAVLGLVGPSEPAVVTGPDASLVLDAATDSGRFTRDPREVSAYSLDLLQLGVDRHAACGGDAADAGPIYVRRSDAQIELREPGAGRE